MIKLSVPDMNCGHCKASVESAVAALGGTARVDLSTRQIEVTGQLAADSVIAALAEIGFPATQLR